MQRSVRLSVDHATDQTKRELFARLAVHLETLAREVERAMAAPRKALPPGVGG